MKQIAIIRKQQGMEQKALAAKVGIRNDSLCKIEKGKGTPSMSLLFKIAEALNVEAKDLF